tara:strand:+ start:9854 stop:10078 length:225 start_codon:yes stop_codon:yes gene_type:complete
MLISTFIIYYILSTYLNIKTDDSKENKSKFSLEYLIISVFVGIVISLLVSFIKANKEETILTDNYWDKLPNESI